MTTTRARWSLTSVLVLGLSLIATDGSGRPADKPLRRDVELEALQEAVSWPNADTRAIVILAGRLVAARRDGDAHAYFHARATSEPDRAIFVALDGFFQARAAADVSLFRRVAWVEEAIAQLDRAASMDGGLPRYFRGLVLAELPRRFRKAEAAVADLDWVLQNKDRFPLGLRRSVYRGLARAYTTLGREAEARAALERSGYASLDPALPIFATDFQVTATDGFRFRSPRLVEPAPRVYVAQGYDFADIAFVATDGGVVAIDAGTTEVNARAALAALRRITTQPITHVILTHAHWDHIGGLAALKAPGTRVIAQARFAEELRKVNETGVPFQYFFGREAARRFDVVPDYLVNRRETLTVGGTEFVLHPVRGGETEDALVVHLPASRLAFVGDLFMPYLGAPFVAEGSPDGLFESLALVRSLEARQLVHGHPPLTENFTVEMLPAFEEAMREVFRRTLRAIGDGRTLAETLDENILPATLRGHPAAVPPFLLMRSHFIERVYHQHTGYWKADGEGIETVAPREWAGALDLLGGGREDAFVRAARALLDRGDDVLALKLADLGLASHPGGSALGGLRRQALDRLRARYQQLDPFKFIVYSEWAGIELPAVE
jgi:glyoxylase-like metal-dependent hydrolase (beta-lactamase superfamily II)